MTTDPRWTERSFGDHQAALQSARTILGRLDHTHTTDPAADNAQVRKLIAGSSRDELEQVIGILASVAIHALSGCDPGRHEAVMKACLPGTIPPPPIPPEDGQ